MEAVERTYGLGVEIERASSPVGPVAAPTVANGLPCADAVLRIQIYVDRRWSVRSDTEATITHDEASMDSGIRGLPPPPPPPPPLKGVGRPPGSIWAMAITQDSELIKVGSSCLGGVDDLSGHGTEIRMTAHERTDRT
jgi:hypothetical protein